MDNMEQSEGFNFTYSAKDQEESKAIRKKYLPPEEDKLQKVRAMKARVLNKATSISLITGVIGILVMGIGMCCCLVWQGAWFVPGIIIGLIGIIAVGMAYPVYRHVTKKERGKIASDILRLTEELMK